MTGVGSHDGVRAIVTGGASGSAPRSSRHCRTAARPSPCSTCSPLPWPGRSRRRATSATTHRSGSGRRGRRAPRRPGRPGEQRRHRRTGHGVRTTPTTSGRRVYEVNRPRGRAAVPCRTAAPAGVRQRQHREHVLDRRDRRAPARALYSATKGAIAALTGAMAADHLREGIRVNAVNPGTADTPWVGRLCSRPAADPCGGTLRPGGTSAARQTRRPRGGRGGGRLPDESARAVDDGRGPGGSTAGCRRCGSGPA